MALERAQISVLRRRAGAHPPFAQIDLFEILPRLGRIEVEQRTLRQRQPNRAIDIALRHFIAAGEALVERFQYATRLLAGFARSFQRHLIAARRCGYAKPALDQREVLSILSKQRRGEAIVIEGKRDLRGIVRCDDERFIGLGSHSGSCGGKRRLSRQRAK